MPSANSAMISGVRLPAMPVATVGADAVTSQLFDSYRPERHYMRGPGPKWRAKHAQPKVTAEPDLGGAINIAA